MMETPEEFYAALTIFDLPPELIKIISRFAGPFADIPMRYACRTWSAIYNYDETREIDAALYYAKNNNIDMLEMIMNRAIHTDDTIETMQCVILEKAHRRNISMHFIAECYARKIISERAVHARLLTWDVYSVQANMVAFVKIIGKERYFKMGKTELWQNSSHVILMARAAIICDDVNRLRAALINSDIRIPNLLRKMVFEDSHDCFVYYWPKCAEFERLNIEEIIAEKSKFANDREADCAWAATLAKCGICLPMFDHIDAGKP